MFREKVGLQVIMIMHCYGFVQLIGAWNEM